ncbi:MAG: aromatic ring-hydroxylating dioxygenase subunit alpha [Gammaproteobacteria bacterium]|nr:aromatic ring-hydroxylating dioxygenase subunit alpha [Gammaproteobacteria bacterium]
MEESYKSVLDNSRGLPGSFYTSDEIFTAELVHFMSKNWACAGLARDVSETGDISPVTLAGQPLVVTCAEDGNIRSFHNICRHRGTVLSTEAKHNQARIVCPNHAWSYALDGALLATPHAGGAGTHHCESMNGEDLDLVEIPTAVWGPFVMVNLNGGAGRPEDALGPIEDRLGNPDLGLLRTGPDYDVTLDVDANWKLAVENFVESYHVPMVHPELQRVNPMEDHYQILGGDHYIGLGGRADGVAGSFDPPLPVFPHCVNMDKYEAIYIAPNLMVTCLPNLFKVIILHPLGPGRTRERLVVFFIGDEAMREDLSDARATVMRDWSLNVNDQDIGIIEKMQKGRSSTAFDGGRFMPKQEATTLHFQKMLAKRMLKALEPSYQPPAELPVANIYHD